MTASMMGYGASSSSRLWKYDVFLSFCGQDTRRNFIDHLFNALVRDGIHTFRDDEEINRGEDISSELMGGIEGSRIAIIVFSENYGSSTWCLGELMKILDCRKDGRIEKVLPVFHKVDPSDVRHQRNTYAEAFKGHEERFKDELVKVKKWRDAVTEAANLSGWDQEKVANGYEAELIKKIVEKVWTIVNQTRLHVAAHPIGLDSHIKSIGDLVNDGRSDIVRIIGIYGSGGIGKTTIAKAIFNEIFENFEGSSFLANVRSEISTPQKGLALLQKQLISNVLKRKDIDIDNEDQGIIIIKERLCLKKVLIIIDDVEEIEHFYKLVGGHDWFGRGSRIILTTRDEHLLNTLEVDIKYKVETMNPKESLELFSWHAFQQNHPLEDYAELSNDVIHYVGGLPLALTILGSLLYKRNQLEWETELMKLRKIPNAQILEKLEISYNALDHFNQTIFLDISCFFLGEHKEYVIKILDACGLGGEVGVKLLIERSLITIDEDNRLCMHDLIRDVGKEIVRKQSPRKPGERSRLWDQEDVVDILTNFTGTEAVEGLQLTSHGHFKTIVPLKLEGFFKMTNLRLLQVEGSFSSIQIDWAHSLQEQVFCFKNLVWINWREFPFEFIPNNFHLGNLAILDMKWSKLKEVWEGTKYLTKLKHLNLSYSSGLTHTPDFTGLPNLEDLILFECANLVKVHKSIRRLKELVQLDLGNCIRLKSLPLLPSSLHSLNASGCFKLKRLPNLSNLKHLNMLDLSCCDMLAEIEGLVGLLQKPAVNIRVARCFNLNYFFNKRILQEIPENGVYDLLFSSRGRNVVPEWFGHQTESDSSSIQVTRPHNMDIQGLIVCIDFLDANRGTEAHSSTTLSLVVFNESQNFTWSHERVKPPSDSEHTMTTWVIKIPNCVWKSMSAGDIINVSLEETELVVKKVGVHFYASHLESTSEENSQASLSNQCFGVFILLLLLSFFAYNL